MCRAIGVQRELQSAADPTRDCAREADAACSDDEAAAIDPRRKLIPRNMNAHVSDHAIA
jgi:hypothetical protein